MSTPGPKIHIALPEENHPWLKYLTVMGAPGGVFFAFLGLCSARPDVAFIYGPIGIAASIYTLRVTNYLRHWESLTLLNRGIGIVAMLSGFLFTFATFLIIIPFVKPFTDRLGQEEPKRYGNSIDDLVAWFRQITNDPTLPVDYQAETTSYQSPPASEQSASQPQPAQRKATMTKSWLAPFINLTKSITPEFLDDATVYTIQLPKGSRWEPAKAKSFMEQILISHISPDFGGVTFQVVAQDKQITWQLVDTDNSFIPDVIVSAVKSVAPNARIKALPYKPPEVDTAFNRGVFVYKQMLDFIGPMKHVSEFHQLDPLASMIQNMSDLQEGSRIIYTLHVISFLDDKERQDALKRTTRFNFDLSGAKNWEEMVAGGVIQGALGALGKRRAAKYVPEEQKVLEDRLNIQPLYVCYLMHQVDVPVDAEKNDMGRIAGLFGSIDQFTSGMNAFTAHREYTQDDIITLEEPISERKSSSLGLITIWKKYGQYVQTKAPGAMVLSPSELAGLWHLPHEGFATDEINWLEAGVLPRELEENTKGILIGHNFSTGYKLPVRIPEGDRDTHMTITGKTKVGKSTLVHNLIHQDIAEGRGVGVIDPHGQLVSDILRSSIPDSRIDDVVVIDIANKDYPPPLNPLLLGEAGESTAGQFMAILETVYDFSGAYRVANALSKALTTLGAEATPTVRDIRRLFKDNEYRDQLLDKIDHIPTLDFWEDFDELSPGNQDQRAVPAIERVQKFYGNKTLYPMMCHPKSLNFARFISERKIVLVSLQADRRKVEPAEQRVLGIILVLQMQLAAMSSLDNPMFYLYIDEAQNFTTTALDTILSEARKFNLGLILANQFLDQLKGNILNAVIGNVGTSVVFQVGEKDARFLRRRFEPVFTESDLTHLDLYNATVHTRLGGKNLAAFSIQTLPPLDEPEDATEREAMIRKRSKDLYTPMSRKEVKDWLDKRYPRTRRKRGGKKDGGENGNDDWLVDDEAKPSQTR